MDQNNPSIVNQTLPNKVNSFNKPNIWKILFLILFFLIFTSGLVLAGYYFAGQKLKSQEVPSPTPINSQAIVVSLTNPPIEKEEFDDSDLQVKFYKNPVKVEKMGVMKLLQTSQLLPEGPGTPDFDQFDLEKNSDYYRIGIMKDPLYKDKELYLVHVKNLTSLFGNNYDDLLRFIKDNDKNIILVQNSYYYFEETNKPIPAQLEIDKDFLIKSLKKEEYKIAFSYQNKELIFEGGNSPYFDLNFPVKKIGRINQKDFYQEEKMVKLAPTLREVGKLRRYFLRFKDSSYQTFNLSPELISNIPQKYTPIGKQENTEVPIDFKINWTDGLILKSDSNYNYIPYSEFNSDRLISGITTKSKISYYDKMINLNSELVKIGSNTAGEEFFTLKDKNHLIYTDFYSNRNDYSDFVKNLSFESFLANRPVFFWKDLFGDYHALFRADFEIAAGIAKPAVYLYPEKEMRIIVKIDSSLINLITIPEYKQGWQVLARPDGTIISKNKTYDYLYYEGDKKVFNFKANEADIVKKENLAFYLPKKLASLGLNQKETRQFIKYWQPKMNQYNFYEIAFMNSNDLDKELPLYISPKPKTVIRILMSYKGVKTDKEIIHINNQPPKRQGFTVVEWGGLKNN